MPIFKYLCKDCNHEFEKIVQTSTELECPSCNGTTLEKQLSVFNLGGPRREFAQMPAPGPCGSCGDPRGPGSCSIN